MGEKWERKGREKLLQEVKLSSMLGWELTVSERKTFRSGSIHVGMLKVIKVGEMYI